MPAGALDGKKSNDQPRHPQSAAGTVSPARFPTWPPLALVDAVDQNFHAKIAAPQHITRTAVTYDLRQLEIVSNSVASCDGDTATLHWLRRSVSGRAMFCRSRSSPGWEIK